MVRALGFVTFLWASCLALAGGDQEALEQLREQLAPMESLSADFRQEVLSADGHVIQEATGSLALARPGMVYWHSEAPFEQLVVSDAETLWVYDPDLAQVTVRPFERNIRDTPAVLFIGQVEELERRYRVEKTEEGPVKRYWLLPRDQDSLYEKLALDFQNGRPVAMALWDSLGQETRIALSGVEINKSLDTDLFRFDPPAGVDILRDD